MRVGERIRQVRRERRLSLQQVAKAADISAATLSRVENGKQTLDVELLFDLARILGSDPASFLAEQEPSQNGRDQIQPIISMLTSLNSDQRTEMWERLADQVKGSDRRRVRGQAVGTELDELIAQLEALCAAFHKLRKSI